MKITINRYSRSYNFKRNPVAANGWGNNDINNSLDDFILTGDDGTELFRCKAQTVSNIPGGRFLDTLAPGPFQLCLFVEKRAFYGRVHGIVNAYDLEGQFINDRSIEPVKGKTGSPISYDRWLMHDWQKHYPAPEGEDTRVAWSAGCIVVPDLDLKRFGALMDSLRMEPGFLIDGEIKELS